MRLLPGAVVQDTSKNRILTNQDFCKVKRIILNILCANETSVLSVLASLLLQLLYLSDAAAYLKHLQESMAALSAQLKDLQDQLTLVEDNLLQKAGDEGLQLLALPRPAGDPGGEVEQLRHRPSPRRSRP